MGRGAKYLLAAALAALCAFSARADDRGVPARLTADTMDYDVDKGDFKAEGHVKLIREGLTLESKHGVANVQTRKARVWESVHAYGTHNGEKLDARCVQLDTDFSVPGGDYLMTGNVDAAFGPRVLKSAAARLTGRAFSARSVEHFEDRSRSLVIKCDVITGDYDARGLRVADGRGSVYGTHEDKDKHFDLWCDTLSYSRERDRVTGTGDARIRVTQKADARRVTDIRGETLVYRFEAGSLTATGNARAVQDGRRVSAETLVYYPGTGKLEAVGKPSITLDLASPATGAGGRPAADGRSPRRPRQGARGGRE